MFSTYVYLVESGDTHAQAEDRAKQLKSHLTQFLDKAAKSYKEYVRH